MDSLQDRLIVPPMAEQDALPGDDIHVSAQGIEKRYGGVRALRGVSVHIRRGEGHALVGENGAGKSTLGKIIAGSVAADGGSVFVNGRAVRYRRPSDARRDGIAIIDQELAILPHRTVLDNVFLGSEQPRLGILSRRRQLEEFERLAAEYGFSGLDPRAVAGELRVADQQQVEILRALAHDASLIVMDEPTAPLSRREVENLHRVVRGLREQGTSIVFVSHFLDEVLEITDTVTVMKDGQKVRTAPTATETKDSLVLGMLGRTLESVFPEKPDETAPGAPVLSVTGLGREGVLRDIALEVRAGEIVGLGGLVGSGRTETLRAIFGVDPIDAGELRVGGKPVRHRSPGDAMRNGLALVPESRKTQGLLMGRSIQENILLPALGSVSSGGIVRRRREAQKIEEMVAELGIKLGDASDPVSTLSGGNQQKVAIAKWLVGVPRLLMIDEPTRGVDIGAKASIYRVLRALADQGVAILLVSSELEELLGLSDRVYVLSRGRIVAEFAGDLEAQEEAVLSAAFA